MQILSGPTLEEHHETQYATALAGIHRCTLADLDNGVQHALIAAATALELPAIDWDQPRTVVTVTAEQGQRAEVVWPLSGEPAMLRLIPRQRVIAAQLVSVEIHPTTIRSAITARSLSVRDIERHRQAVERYTRLQLDALREEHAAEAVSMAAMLRHAATKRRELLVSTDALNTTIGTEHGS